MTGCRLHALLGVHDSTKASQLREILEVEVQAWFDSSDHGAFRDWRQEMLLAFFEVIERAGSKLAYPTRALHVEGLPPAGELSSSRWPPASR